MFFSIIAASALAALGNAQSFTISTNAGSSVAPSTTISQIMPPSATQAFNKANVSSSEAFNWCQGQRNNCPYICGGTTSMNMCDSVAFTYNCVCQNGTVPDCTAFTQTLPFFMCQATFAQCLNAHPNDAEGQAQCAANEKCGTRNATAEALARAAGTGSTTTASGTRSASSGASAAGTSATSSGSAEHAYTFSGAMGALLMGAVNFLV